MYYTASQKKLNLPGSAASDWLVSHNLNCTACTDCEIGVGILGLLE